MKEPKTLQQAIQFFANPNNCIDYIGVRRWPDGVVCPTCDSREVKFLPTRNVWECKNKHPRKQFSIKVGTIFEDSPIGLDKWLTAMWMICNCKNGVSSYEIGRTIGVTQKSAWFMLHRIRLAMKEGSIIKLGGGIAGTATPVEVDETFVGGKARNMHKSRKIRLEQMKTAGLKNETKTIVAGLIDRKKGKVRAEVVPIRNLETLDAFVRKNVHVGSVVYTDDFQGYDNLRSRFAHDKLNKQVQGYVKGRVHTQGIENFWSLLKRGLGGTYVAVEPFHLFRYLDEQVFRFNTRKDGNRKINDAERFDLALGQVAGRRLTFAEVTGKVGETTH